MKKNGILITDTCPLGDTSNQDVAFGKNCSEIADKFPQLCQNATINSTWCCDSCSNVHSNTTGEVQSIRKHFFCDKEGILLSISS